MSKVLKTLSILGSKEYWGTHFPVRICMDRKECAPALVPAHKKEWGGGSNQCRGALFLPTYSYTGRKECAVLLDHGIA